MRPSAVLRFQLGGLPANAKEKLNSTPCFSKVAYFYRAAFNYISGRDRVSARGRPAKSRCNRVAKPALAAIMATASS